MSTPWYFRQKQPDATDDHKKRHRQYPKNGRCNKHRNPDGHKSPHQSEARSEATHRVLRTDLNTTIECLLALRSVRDQFIDAGLDLLTSELADKLVSLEKGLLDHLVEQREHQEGLSLLTVSVVGDFNSGKSTFINALLGTDLCR